MILLIYRMHYIKKPSSGKLPIPPLESVLRDIYHNPMLNNHGKVTISAKTCVLQVFNATQKYTQTVSHEKWNQLLNVLSSKIGLSYNTLLGAAPYKRPLLCQWPVILEINLVNKTVRLKDLLSIYCHGSACFKRGSVASHI